MGRKNGQSGAKAQSVLDTPPIRFAPEDKQVPVNSQTVARSRSSFSLLSGLLARVGIVYLLVAAFWRCPTQAFSFNYPADHELLVCRELSSIQEHWTPAVKDFASSTRKQLHPYIGSYLDKAEDAAAYVQPVFQNTAAQAHTFFTQRVHPGARDLAKQAHTWSLPHQRTLHKHYKKNLHPHVDSLYKASKPYINTYRRDVEPHLKTVLAQAQTAHNQAWAYYEHEIHPRIKTHLYNSYLFGRHKAYPVAHQHYFQYAHPHLSSLVRWIRHKIDDALVKYGVRKRSVFDSVLNNVKDTYRQTDDTLRANVKQGLDAVGQQIPSSDTAVDSHSQVHTKTQDEPLPVSSSSVLAGVQASSKAAEAASPVLEHDWDDDQEDDSQELQHRLDTEMEKVDSRLNQEAAFVSEVVNKERKRLTKELVSSRREIVTKLPEILASPHEYITREVFPVLFDTFLNRFRKLGESLSDPHAPSDAWRTEFQAISDDLSDRIIWYYSHTREVMYDKLSQATNRTAVEQEMIQEGVAAIRSQIRKALAVYYDLMEDAEFQVTLLENQGWDSGMKRRARLFREEMHEFLDTLTIHGEPTIEGQMILPNIEQEKQEAISGVNTVMWELEKSITRLTTKLAENPAMLTDRPQLADLLLDMYDTRQHLSELSLENAKQSALRLRKYIGDANEKLGRPRKPDSGLVSMVWDMPTIEGTEDYAIPLEESSTGEWTSEEAIYDPDSVADADAMFQQPLVVDANDESGNKADAPYDIHAKSQEAYQSQFRPVDPSIVTSTGEDLPSESDSVKDAMPDFVQETVPDFVQDAMPDSVRDTVPEPAPGAMPDAFHDAPSDDIPHDTEKENAIPPTPPSPADESLSEDNVHITKDTAPTSSESAEASSSSASATTGVIGDASEAVNDAAALVAKLLQGFQGDSEASDSADQHASADAEQALSSSMPVSTTTDLLQDPSTTSVPIEESSTFSEPHSAEHDEL
ncbi:hypothetical protein MYAM1_002110 [Malassezia yamatoensis]|uniref:Uncharacterized protein n=1 Tax=Malassezia yamatoensis TaxID=253288 RepID=A0AAJ5YVA8_9BASI|nr:hypothetical protein MYAM1_002110 [Malassezia yamatoensis]